MASPEDCGLILLAHGSRRKGWSARLEALAEQVTAALPHVHTRLTALDHAPKSFAEVTAELADAGVTRIAVLPMFMASGGHVTDDLPALVQEAQAQRPQLRFELLPPVGEHPLFGGLVERIAQESAHALLAAED